MGNRQYNKRSILNKRNFFKGQIKQDVSNNYICLPLILLIRIRVRKVSQLMTFRIFQSQPFPFILLFKMDKKKKLQIRQVSLILNEFLNQNILNNKLIAWKSMKQCPKKEVSLLSNMSFAQDRSCRYYSSKQIENYKMSLLEKKRQIENRRCLKKTKTQANANQFSDINEQNTDFQDLILNKIKLLQNHMKMLKNKQNSALNSSLSEHQKKRQNYNIGGNKIGSRDILETMDTFVWQNNNPAVKYDYQQVEKENYFNFQNRKLKKTPFFIKRDSATSDRNKIQTIPANRVQRFTIQNKQQKKHRHNVKMQELLQFFSQNHLHNDQSFQQSSIHIRKNRESEQLNDNILEDIFNYNIGFDLGLNNRKFANTTNTTCRKRIPGQTILQRIRKTNRTTNSKMYA